MNKQRKHSVPAFTIFEVTIVLAIMSVLVTMVTFSINRLFDQTRVTQEIHSELNNFYKVRSTLWYDCITADSLTLQAQEIHVFKKENKIQYSLDEEQLFRSVNGTKRPLDVIVRSLEMETTKEGEEIVLTFDWKGEALPWRFFNRRDVAGSVNQYFDGRNG
jgi:type II secretory pathway pseudopilin PulG